MPLLHWHSPAATSRKARRGRGKAALCTTPTVQLHVPCDCVTTGCCQQSSAALLHLQPHAPPRYTVIVQPQAEPHHLSVLDKKQLSKKK